MNRRMRELRGLWNGRQRWAVALGAVALAVGGIVLVRAPSGRAVPFYPQPAPANGATTASAQGRGLSYTFGLSQSRVVAGQSPTVQAEIRLQAQDADSGEAVRAPVALAVVLDVSGSMSGEKIEQAKDAVARLVERMHPEDRMALVTYNHTAQIVQPLTPVAAVRERLPGLVKQLYAGGGTSIPPALMLGASQLQGAPDGHLRRVVLVSDGLDGSGQELTAVTHQLELQSQTGTYVSSLGVGVDYDERWLTSVADAGRGNYAFLASGSELATFLRRELDEASGTVVDKVVANLSLPTGWRVVRAVGAPVPPPGQSISIPVGPMFRGDERRVVLELQGDSTGAGSIGEVALEVQYRTVADDESRSLERGALAVEAVASEAMARASVNPEVHARATAALLELDQAAAVEAWRHGDTARAQSITQRSLGVIRDLQAAVPSAAPALQAPAEAWEAESQDFDRYAPTSEAGRGFGLRSGAARRERSRR